MFDLDTEAPATLQKGCLPPLPMARRLLAATVALLLALVPGADAKIHHLKLGGDARAVFGIEAFGK